jgi:5-formyltetrahydrofolate cyclo-ligase
VNEPPDIVDRKKALRARMKAWRDGLGGGTKVHAAQAIAEQGFSLVLELREVARQGVVSGFAAMPDELNIWPLLRRLHGAGVPLALPVVEAKGRPLAFRAWAPGDTMDKGVWGIPQPKRERQVLGYGGGFYDRTLAGLRARKPIAAIGLAYNEQQVDAVPHLDYDQRLDWVLTPSGPIRCQADASVVPR